jgi:hypothetical protein
MFKILPGNPPKVLYKVVPQRGPGVENKLIAGIGYEVRENDVVEIVYVCEAKLPNVLYMFPRH